MRVVVEIRPIGDSLVFFEPLLYSTSFVSLVPFDIEQDSSGDSLEFGFGIVGMILGDAR